MSTYLLAVALLMCFSLLVWMSEENYDLSRQLAELHGCRIEDQGLLRYSKVICEASP